MENNGNIKLKNGNIFWKWKIGNIFPIWNIDISSICQSPSVSLRFSEKSHEKHLHPLFITAFDENKTRESFPFFFFFFNAIKAADRHRGLAQRGISQSQLIASSFSFFFFFFLFNRFAASKRIYSPLTIVNRGTMKFDEFTGRCSYRDAQILSLKHSLPRLNWSWIVTSRFDLLSPHHGIHRFVQIIKRYPMRH